jgi:regulator of protease activity HflC (stomatin/prohibitin superfamily)
MLGRPRIRVVPDGTDFGDAFGRAMGGLRGRFPGKQVFWIIVAFIALVYVIGHSIVPVGAGERAVIFSQVSGVLPMQLGEGWHLVVPWVWQPTTYDVRKHTWTITIGEKVPQLGQAPPEPELAALTRDGQQVGLDISAVYHPDPEKVWRLHQRIGPYYVDKVLRPEARATCRAVVSQYAVTEVYSGRREEIQTRISEELSERLKRWDIILDELLLRNVQFSAEFQQAVEAKQVAIQEFERMTYVLQGAEKERQKTVIQAEGEAQSLRLRGQALRQNPLTVKYTYAQKIAPSVGAIITDKATTPPGAAGGGR